MISVLATVAAAVLILSCLMSLAVLTSLLRLRVQRPQTEPLASPQVPNDARKLLAPGLAQLLELGFAHPAPLRMTWLRVAGEAVPLHALVLTHPRVPAAGYVVQLAMPDRGRHFGIYFVSRMLACESAQRTLVTRNRASTAGPMPQPDIITQDCWLPTWGELWKAHQRKMKSLQPDPMQWQRLSPAEWLQAGGLCDAEAFDLRVQRGHLVDAGDGSWRTSLGQALLTVGRAWTVWIRASRGMEGDRPNPRPRPDLKPGPAAALAAASAADSDGVARLVQTYEQDSRQRRSARWSNAAKWMVFFLTAAVAAGSFGLSMGLDVLPALLCVLLFHEVGHFAAMRWAGYSDLKVFFLPFLGAAVSGRHDSASAKQELIVLFAGPVPGLLLGLAGLLWLPADVPAADWWRSCSALAVTINAFNLPPIHPLDGGKIFEILLLGRWPWAAFAGRVLGLLTLGWLVMTMEGSAGRIVVGAMLLLMVLGLAHQRREALLAVALRSAGQWGGLERAEALQALFGAMGRIGLLKRPWGDLRLMADALLPTMTRPRLRRRERAGGLVVYAFFLLLPLLALLFYLSGALQGADGRMAGADARRRGAGAADARTASPDSGRAGGALAAGQAGAGPAGAEPQMEALFAGLHQRVMAEPDAARRWMLLEAEFAPMINGMPADELGRLPSAQALLREALRLAPGLADPVAKQATASLWQVEFLADRVERRQVLASVIGRYDDAAAAAADPAPLADAAIEWLTDRSVDAPSRMVMVDKVLARLQDRDSGARQGTLQVFKLDLMLAQGDAAGARQLAQQWLARASVRPGSADHLRAAQQWADVVLVTEGPAAALRVVDQVLQPLDATPAQDTAHERDSLRRSGLWLAEATGRREWQAAQVPLLLMPGSPDAGLPWWARLLFWSASGGRPAPATLPQLESAHWRGDEAQARELAATVCRRPGVAAGLVGDGDADQPLTAARRKLVTNGRRAICERYGGPATFKP